MDDTELSNAIKDRASRHRAPQSLRVQVQNELDALAETAPVQAAATHRNRGLAWQNWFGGGNGLAAGASFAFGVALAFGIVVVAGTGSIPLWPSPASVQVASRSALSNEIVANHVRSLMASHLMDVISTDQHTVKPWFNGKVDFSPPVVDLAAQGYPLAGGRLDYINGHTVAALVYRHNTHAINVFVWPEAGADQHGAAEFVQGYQLAQWRHDGMRFAAVSDVSADELKTFVVALGQP